MAFITGAHILSRQFSQITSNQLPQKPIVHLSISYCFSIKWSVASIELYIAKNLWNIAVQEWHNGRRSFDHYNSCTPKHKQAYQVKKSRHFQIWTYSLELICRIGYERMWKRCTEISVEWNWMKELPILFIQRLSHIYTFRSKTFRYFDIFITTIFSTFRWRFMMCLIKTL